MYIYIYIYIYKKTQKKDHLVQTNVGLNLLKKHFPASHILHKILNKSTVKISYS